MLLYSLSDQAIGFKDSFRRRRVALKSGTGSLGRFDCARKVMFGKGSGAAAFQSIGRTRAGCVRDIERRPKIDRGRDGRGNMLRLELEASDS
jgi:hypothetical protein